MKAPDKIYLAFDHGFIAQSSNIKEDINGNSIFLSQYVPIEYVRKDALLEWANRLKEKWEEPPMSIHSPGCVFMLEQVIKKLNSM